MGTRANFFIGDPAVGDYEWLGCVAFDGYEFAEDKNGKYALGMVTDEDVFRMFVDIVKSERQDFADPNEGGYPFPWVDDIFLTDFSYAFIDGKVKVTAFNCGWVDVADYDNINWDEIKPALPKVSIGRAWDKKQPDSIIRFGVNNLA